MRYEVVAGEVADEIRGTDDDRSVDELHGSSGVSPVRRPCCHDTRDPCQLASHGPLDVAHGRQAMRVVGNPGRSDVGRVVDQQIREAMDNGAFDDLPYSGRGLPIVDDSAAGDCALGYRVLRNADVAPPWIETDKEVRDLLARRDALLARAAAGLLR